MCFFCYQQFIFKHYIPKHQSINNINYRKNHRIFGFSTIVQSNNQLVYPPKIQQFPIFLSRLKRSKKFPTISMCHKFLNYLHFIILCFFAKKAAYANGFLVINFFKTSLQRLSSHMKSQKRQSPQ